MGTVGWRNFSDVPHPPGASECPQSHPSRLLSRKFDSAISTTTRCLALRKRRGFSGYPIQHFMRCGNASAAISRDLL